MVKEALHTPANDDRGYEWPGCWITTIKKLGGGAGCTSTNHIGTLSSAPDMQA